MYQRAIGMVRRFGINFDPIIYIQLFSYDTSICPVKKENYLELFALLNGCNMKRAYMPNCREKKEIHFLYLLKI